MVGKTGEKMPYCTECGREVREEDAYCPHCGANLREPEVEYVRPRAGWQIGRIAAVLIGGLILLASFGLLAGGTSISWLNRDFVDDEGYIMSGEAEIYTDAYALVSTDIDVEMGDEVPPFIRSITGRGDIITLKLEAIDVDPGEEVFIGVARSVDAEAYLRDVSYDEVSQLSDSSTWRDRLPEVSYVPHQGGAPSAPPTAVSFWDTFVTGSGTQVLEWEPVSGSFWIVVMNADGSPGVDLNMKVGARVPILDTVGNALIVGGLVALAVGAFIVYYGAIRRP